MKKLALSAVLSAALTGCGSDQPRGGEPSDLEWVQSRTGNTRYAYLQTNDLADEFIFGASVIGVQDFISNALNMVVRPTKVKLKLRTSAGVRKLDVVTASSNETLLSFNATTRAGRTEIDFGSAGNDLKLRSLINTLGGMYTVGDENGYWVSQAAPTVAGIQQDNDTMVVDLLHTVSQAEVHTDIFGRVVVDRIISDHPGKVTVRVFLKRKKTLPRLGASRTIGAGKQKNIGYFGTDLSADSPATKIQRFALGDATDAQPSITFFLKGVPAAYEGVARQAILSWNQAFDRDRIKVQAAPAWMDAGDPRYNVVKWFDGLDDDVRWAGVAKMTVEPETGLVMGGHLYLNGGSVIDMYRGITQFSQQVAVGGIGRVTGTIGNVTFDRDEGETPVIPYITDLSQNFEQYMQGYYLETIAHEVGHVLGLRHNFRGSTELSGDQSASVMDYTPRSERTHYRGPGTYDIAAIKWGYFGTDPGRTLPYCTDEDLWTYFDCSQGDFGDPVENAVFGLLDGTLLLTKKAVAVTDDVFISSMAGALENALKIKKLSSQLPAATRSEAVKKIDAAYSYLYSATAVAGGASDLATINANLSKLRELTRKREQELREQGRL